MRLYAEIAALNAVAASPRAFAAAILASRLTASPRLARPRSIPALALATIIAPTSLARGGSKQRALSSGRYVGHAACGGPREQGQRRCVATTTHVLLYSGGELTWAEPLANLGALEQTGDAVVMHLRDGGVRLVPCAGGASERNECFELIDRCLRAQ